MSKASDDVKTGILELYRDKSRGYLFYCLGGIRHRDGATRVQAVAWNVRTCRSDVKGDVSSGKPTRTRVPKLSTGAEQSVVVMKYL